MIKTISSSKEIQEFLGAEPLQSASIRVTMACNLRCKQCYAIAGEKLKNELSLKEIKKVMDELKKLGAIRIFITGGEPFARPDILEILKYADKNNFAIYISTNGTLVTPEIIKSLKSLKHLRTFQISIDGIGKTHDLIRGVKGTYKKALKTIKLATKELKNTKVAIISTLMKRNINEMEKILKLALHLKVDTFGIVTLYPVKRSMEAIDVSTSEKYRLFQRLSKIYQEQKTKLSVGLHPLVPPALVPKSLGNVEYGCGYVCSFPSLLGIHANGDVAPCDGLLSYKQFILGNVRTSSLKKIWNHPLMKKLRDIEPTNIKGVCKKCKYLSYCMGGCRAKTFIETGSFVDANPLCQSFYDSGFFPEESIDYGISARK